MLKFRDFENFLKYVKTEKLKTKISGRKNLVIWKSEYEKNCYKGKGSEIEQKLPTLFCKNCLCGEGRGQLLVKSLFFTAFEVNTLNFIQKIHVDTDTMQLCLKFEMYLAEKKYL